MQRVLRVAATVSALLVLPMGVVCAVEDGAGDPAAVKSDDGKWTDKEGNPTFKIEADGTVDWYTYVGFTRYSSECLRCHGPDGMGSTYAPALTDSMKTSDLFGFLFNRRERQKGCVVIAGSRHAGARRQQERHVFHRRNLHLSPRPRRWRDRTRPSGKARAEAGRI